MKKNAAPVPSHATVAEDALRRVVDATPALIHIGRPDGRLESGKVSGANGAAAWLGLPASTLASKIRPLRINKFPFKGV